MNPSFSTFNPIKIEKGQEEFSFALELEPEDYGIFALASWDTTVSIVEKTNKGFKLKFEKKCPEKGGWLYLNIHS